jgi:extracellular factor (EF) 3-hydroxypalmitic acid methyl ester biosynthesis protein
MMELQKRCKVLTKEFSRLTDNTTQKQLNDFIFTFSGQVEYLESHHARQDITACMEDIRKAVAASPFLKRAQQWPRGYAGDFQTIEYMLSGNNKAMPGTLAWAIEQYFLSSPICDQHRNKISEQVRLLKETIQRKPGAHILSIGCGTSEDIFQCMADIASADCRLTLVDIDAMALVHSMERLADISGKITAIEGNIYRIIKKLTGPFDLVIIGGVFDYLEDKVIVAIINELSSRLNEEGILYFTNIAEGNPYRICMEYLANWILIERSKAAIEQLLQNSKAAELTRHIVKEKAGLTWLVTVHNHDRV